MGGISIRSWAAGLTLCLGLWGAAPSRDVLLATTTSTQDTGLLELLVPRFEAKTGYRVKTLAVGSGQAMAMGRKGEVDVLLVHSPEAELAFMAEGFGADRRRVMHNDFILLGPHRDPAGIRGLKAAAEALRRIAAQGALFVSRGDQSGTHTQERTLWAAEGLNPEGWKWYQQTGSGMGLTLAVAAEKQGYVLTDRGTYLALRKRLGLDLLCEGDAALRNVYHVIAVSQGRFPKVNGAGAKAFGDFLIEKETQELIRAFGIEKYGSPLFFPDAGK